MSDEFKTRVWYPLAAAILLPTACLSETKVMETEPRKPPPRLREEDYRAFEQLFRFYYRAVIGFFSKRGFTPAECEDLAQDTFANAYRGFGEFRQESSELTWLFSVARNVLNNELRHRNRKKREVTPISLDNLREEGPDLAESVEETQELDALSRAMVGEQRQMLAAALEELPRRRRQVFHLRIVQDLKYREIAALLGIDVNTAKSHVSQAKAQLKSKLGNGLQRVSTQKELSS